MFKWWRDWCNRRKLRRRGLFEYSDGRQVRFADPYALFRALVSDPAVDLEEIGPKAEKGEEPATTELAAFIAKTFGVARFDPAALSGLTDSELFALMERFYDWLEALKKNGAPGVTLPPATAPASSPSPAPPG